LVLLSKFNQEGKFSNKKQCPLTKVKVYLQESAFHYTATSTSSGLERVVCTGKESSMIQWQEGANEEMEEAGQLTNDKKD
jgi:hypothetical protein